MAEHTNSKINIIDRLKFGLILLSCLIISISMPSSGKTRMIPEGSSSGRKQSLLVARPSKFDLMKFEHRVSNHFSVKAGLTKANFTENDEFTEADILYIAKHWHSLSPSFKTIYISSITIPPGFDVFVSPAGNFEVYYTTTGSDAVPAADTYGFDSLNWRDQIVAPNGIPDYIDGVAWALDSSWSMEIDRFGFSDPYPFTDDSHTSDLYKVVVKDIKSNLGEEYYGMTYPYGTIAGKVGLRSLIEIRNDWSNWNNYRDRPLDAAKITCAHEFFHAVQYAMGHDDSPSYIDFFPGAWLEGTAVLMEDLAFDHINDYVQYMNGYNGYFANPARSVLNDNQSQSIDFYANSIVAMFLYWRTFATPSISYIKDIFIRNELQKAEFDTILNISANAAGTSFTSLLNDFHTSSFYTGIRADTARFIPDASILPSWEPAPVVLDENFTSTKTVRSYSMQSFVYMKDSLSITDTLYIRFTTASSAVSGKWALGLILTDTAGINSEIPVTMESASSARIQITDWQKYERAILVVTNGHHSENRDVTVYFTDFFMETQYFSETFDLFPNPIKIISGDPIKIRGQNLIEVYIYSVDGSRIAWTSIHSSMSVNAFRRTNDGFDWMLRNKNGEAIVPGTYIAVIGYKDMSQNKLVRKRKSILVLP